MPSDSLRYSITGLALADIWWGYLNVLLLFTQIFLFQNFIFNVIHLALSFVIFLRFILLERLQFLHLFQCIATLERNAVLHCIKTSPGIYHVETLISNMMRVINVNCKSTIKSRTWRNALSVRTVFTKNFPVISEIQSKEDIKSTMTNFMCNN